jgi:hypothetical protein
MDEAARMPETAITQVFMPMLATTKGTAVMLSTPFDKDHVFYRAFVSPRWSKHNFPSSANPNVTQEYLDEQRELAGERGFTQEFLAEFIDDAKSYFPLSLLRPCIHTCSSLSCEYCALLSGQKTMGQNNEETHFFGGYDPGGKQDPAAFVVVEKVPAAKNSLRMVYSKTYLSDSIREDDNLYTRFTVEIADVHRQKFHMRKLVVDSTSTQGTIVEHCKELGLPAEGLNLSQRSKEEILSNLHVVFEQQRLLLPPDDRRILANLNCIEVERARNGRYSFSHPLGTHDDLAYALAMAVWAATQSSGKVIMMKY